jgi:hypothetical protein
VDHVHTAPLHSADVVVHAFLIGSIVVGAGHPKLAGEGVLAVLIGGAFGAGNPKLACIYLQVSYLALSVVLPRCPNRVERNGVCHIAWERNGVRGAGRLPLVPFWFTTIPSCTDAQFGMQAPPPARKSRIIVAAMERRRRRYCHNSVTFVRVLPKVIALFDQP